MSGTSKIRFSKPWLSHRDQVHLLEQRGLTVPDPQAAEEFLSHLNYYRFSGYCLAFENGRRNFNRGTTFDDVFAAYHFDLTLRDLLTEALEVVEVDLRAAMAYAFGQRYGAFDYSLEIKALPDPRPTESSPVDPVLADLRKNRRKARKILGAQPLLFDMEDS